MTNDVRYSDGGQDVVPLAEEQLHIGKRLVERDRVTLRTRVEPALQSIETRLEHETYTVERVAVDRLVETMPADRQEGETLVIPVVEEVAVVVKRLRVVEELRITRNRFSTPFQESVEVRRMRASVERTPFNSTIQAKD